MVYLLAACTFYVLAIIQWVVAVVLYNGLAPGPGDRLPLTVRAAPVVALAVIALVSFIPFPWGYAANVAVWGLVAAAQPVPPGRRLLYFLLLAAMGFATRLLALGVLAY